MFTDIFGGVTSQEYQSYISSLSGNLVANGDGFLGNIYNFPGFTFDASDTVSGRGSFSVTGYPGVMESGEFISINPGVMYEISAWAKESVNVSGARQIYAGFVPYDIDGNSITGINWLRFVNTDTTLAAPLNVGDTTITLASATNWNQAGYRTVQIYGYKNSGGGLYDRSVNPYTRYVMGTWSVPAFENANVNTGTNVVTLNSAWAIANPAGGAWPIGTKISRGNDGGNYIYTLSGGETLTSSWKYLYGRIGTINTSGAENHYKFPPGMARGKLLFLPNYSAANSNVTLINAVRMSPLPTPSLASYTVATLPDAVKLGAGAMIYVSNESGGAVPAFSDGTNWRRVTDRAVVS